MKLMHYLFSSPIDFGLSNIFQLTIEKPCDLWMMANELYEQCRGKEGRYTLSEDNMQYSFDKEVLFVEAPFGFDRFNKQILQNLSMMIRDGLDRQSTILSVYEALEKLESSISDLASDIDPSIITGEINITMILKSIDVDIDYSGDIKDGYLNLSRLAAKVSKIKMISIINPTHYVSTEDFEHLLSELAYVNLPILVIDSKFSKNYPCKLFDEDFCELNLFSEKGYVFEV